MEHGSLAPEVRGEKAQRPNNGVRPRSRLGRVARLGSTAAWGSENHISDGRAAHKFANFPHGASSARKPAGPRTSSRLSLALVSWSEAKKDGSTAGARPGPTKPTQTRLIGEQAQPQFAHSEDTARSPRSTQQSQLSKHEQPPLPHCFPSITLSQH